MTYQQLIGKLRNEERVARQNEAAMREVIAKNMTTHAHALEWEKSLSVGDVVIARFTNSYNQYTIKACIVKINARTIVVTPVSDSRWGDNARLLIQKRGFMPGTQSNGVFPAPK